MFVVWILLAILAILLILLAIPVDIALSIYRYEGKQTVLGKVRWLYGLVNLRIGGRKIKPRTAIKRSRKKKKKRRHGTRNLLTMLRNQGFYARLFKFIQRLLRCIHINKFSINIRIGLDDPADTGRLWAFIGPIAALLKLPTANIVIAPDFTDEVLEIDGKGTIRMIPIQILFAVLVFVLSPGTLRTFYYMKSAST